jgi:hypothetical protein
MKGYPAPRAIHLVRNLAVSQRPAHWPCSFPLTAFGEPKLLGAGCYQNIGDCRDPIALHSGCASRIAADIRIAANLIVIYYGHSGIVIYNQVALDHTTSSSAVPGIGT